jgi:hypothetical protein
VLLDEAGVGPLPEMERPPLPVSVSPRRQQAHQALGDVAVDLLKLLRRVATPLMLWPESRERVEINGPVRRISSP